MSVATGFSDDGRRDEGLASRPSSWVVNLLLFYCSVSALFLAIGGGGFVSIGMLRASYWALITGLAAIAIIFLWRAARVLRLMRLESQRAKKAALATPTRPLSLDQPKSIAAPRRTQVVSSRRSF